MDAREATRHVRRALLSELVESIDDVLQRIYDAKPRLRPTETATEDVQPAVTASEEDEEEEEEDVVDEATIKTQQLVDRCYQVETIYDVI